MTRRRHVLKPSNQNDTKAEKVVLSLERNPQNTLTCLLLILLGAYLSSSLTIGNICVRISMIAAVHTDEVLRVFCPLQDEVNDKFLPVVEYFGEKCRKRLTLIFSLEHVCLPSKISISEVNLSSIKC